MDLSTSFRTLFSLFFGESMDVIIFKTFYQSPLASLVFFFIYYLIFFIFFNRMLIKIVEAAFHSTKIRKRFYWMEKKMTLEDYIKLEYQQILKDAYNYI